MKATINFMQFKRDNFEEVKEYTEGKAINFRTERHINGKSYCDIKMPNGYLIITEGDYIIKGVDGGIYPCKQDMFLNIYDIVENED